MSKIRVWKLGSLDHKILPTEEAKNQLAKLLEGVHKGEIVDLIWGPDLEVTELNIDTTDTNIVSDE